MAAQAKDASVPRLFFGPEFILVHQIFKYHNNNHYHYQSLNTNFKSYYY